MQVLALEVEMVDRYELQGAVSRLLSAEPPGWEWSIVRGAVGDAVACMRHRAVLRGDEFVELERDHESALVAVRPASTGTTMRLVLVTVKHTRLQ